MRTHAHYYQNSLDAYSRAVKLFTESIEVETPPEILNNIGSLHFRLGNLEGAEVKFRVIEL